MPRVAMPAMSILPRMTAHRARRALALSLLVVGPALQGGACTCAAPPPPTGAASASASSTQPTQVDVGPEMDAATFCASVFVEPLAAFKKKCTGDDASAPELAQMEEASKLAKARCDSVLGEAVKKGRLRIDRAHAEACIAAVRALGRAFLEPERLANLDLDYVEACPGAFEGKASVGAACTSSLDCEPGLSCLGADAGKEGICSLGYGIDSACRPGDVSDALTGRNECGTGLLCLGKERPRPPLGLGGAMGPRLTLADPGKPRLKLVQLTLDPGVSGRGGISDNVALRVVKPALLAVRDCHEKALAKRPGLSGTLEVEWTLEPSGRVQATKKGPATKLDDDATSKCALEALATVPFPASGGGRVRATLELDATLEPAAAPPSSLSTDTTRIPWYSPYTLRAAPAEGVCRKPNALPFGRCRFDDDCSAKTHCQGKAGPERGPLDGLGLCQELRGNGASCTASDQCEGRCVSGVCRAFCGVGEDAPKEVVEHSD